MLQLFFSPLHPPVSTIDLCRQHADDGDDEFFFSGFGGQHEFGDSSGAGGHDGSARDYDYFEVRISRKKSDGL